MNLKILLSGLIVQLLSVVFLLDIKLDDKILIFYIIGSICWWIFLICNPGFGFYENKTEIVIDKEMFQDIYLKKELSEDINNFINIYNKYKRNEELKIFFELVPYKVNEINAIFEVSNEIKYTCVISDLHQLEKYKNVWWEYKK